MRDLRAFSSLYLFHIHPLMFQEEKKEPEGVDDSKETVSYRHNSANVHMNI